MLTIAAIQSGVEPSGPLPPAAFHRTLEDQIVCPKCSASFNLIVDFEQATGRFFPDASRPLLMLLRKAVFMGHADNHRVTHFETSGVTVREVTVPPTPPPVVREPPIDGWSYRKR